jgi:glycosyltransferase involved in cell wall biosynthesis
MKTLTIVVPVTKMVGKLHNLTSWLVDVKNFDAKVIIVHDLQDVGTSKELQEFIKTQRNSDIEYHEIRCGSPGLARNQGLSAAESTWIMFVDSDDLLDLRQVFQLINKSQHDSQILIGSFATKITMAPEVPPKFRPTRNRFDVAMNPGLWRIIFPVAVVNQHRFKEFRMGEDQEFLLGVDLFSRDMRISESIVYTYFVQNPTQLTANKDAISDLTKVIPLTFSYLQKSGIRTGFFISVILLRQLITERKHHAVEGTDLLKNRLNDFCQLKVTKKLQLFCAVLIFAWKKVLNA